MLPYARLIAVPEGKVEQDEHTWEVRHMRAAAGKMERSSMRTILYGGHRVPPLTFRKATRWHELLENGRRWMSDIPIEQWQHRIHVGAMRGRVLIGGLGLGVMVNLLAAERQVDSITVVDIAQPVIDLVWAHVKLRGKPATMVCADLDAYLDTCGNGAFDSAFFDIWTCDSEGQFHEQTLPLLRKARRVVYGPVRAWNEDIMRGQLRQGIMTRFLFLTGEHPMMARQFTLDDLATPTESLYHAWSVPFWQWVKREGGVATRPVGRWLLAAHEYVATLERRIGTEEWQPEWAP
jgi:hypothetical protein